MIGGALLRSEDCMERNTTHHYEKPKPVWEVMAWVMAFRSELGVF
jgi:hypothetical protein